MPYRERSEKPAFSASLRLRRGKFASPLNSVRIVERKDVSKARTCAAPAASCSAKPSTTPAAATNVLEVTVPLSPPGSGPRHWFAARKRSHSNPPGTGSTSNGWPLAPQVGGTGPPTRVFSEKRL